MRRRSAARGCAGCWWRARWPSSASAWSALQAGAFLAYPEGFAKPLILVIEFALMPTLTLILGLMLLGAPRRGESAVSAGTLFGLCAAALIGHRPVSA
jgi:hypothetical protein